MEDNGSFEEKFLSNGDVYIGQFKGLLPHGNGKYTWSDGTIYEGDWIDGKMTGKGLITWTSGSKYEGEFSGGYLHGQGTLTESNGCVYTGGWRMDAHHGVGRKVYWNANNYDGLWKEGIREGCGKFTWNNGSVYLGNWKKGKIDGRGIMKWYNGDIFDGFWLNGHREGSGVYRFSDGGLYIGTWSMGLKDGKGTFYPVGSKQPSLKKWCSILNSDDNSFQVPNPRINRSLSDKPRARGIKKISRHLSLRTSLLDANWEHPNSSEDCICRDSSSALSQASNEGQSEASGTSNMVFEREYMQGVLLVERIRNFSEIPHNKMKRQNKFSVKQVKKKSFMGKFQNRRSYYLKLNLQLGIRYTVGKITPVPAREVRSSDFGERARIRMYFPKKGSQFTPPHSSLDFYWKDYCPMVFRNLREMFKLDAAEYMMSICGDSGLKDITSPGKSGPMSEEVVNVFKKETDHKTQLDGLIALLGKAFPSPQQLNTNELHALVESVVNLEAGSMVVSRQFVLTVLDRLDKAQIPTDALLAAAKRVLDILQTRAISYEEQACVLRYRVADILQKERRFVEAAQTLAGIPVETGQKPMPPAQKMELYLRIATLLLDGNEFQEAEQYVNRAGHQQGDTPQELTNKFKATYARVLDCKRKFIEAAQRYYEVSLLPSINREEKEMALVRAITCTVLASPGTPRTQMLSTLYKDERTHSLPIFGLLQKLFHDRLIKTTELAELENGLDAHQKANEDGQSIVRGVILEHNMTAVSLLYTNISLETLAELLGIDVEKVEEIVVQMISTNRLPGTIDQIDGCVHFKNRSALRQFDDQILAVCQQVNHVSDLILAAHPELAATN